MPFHGRKFKVRTGCVTCKVRKVKCDETKPACLRCTKTGRKCDGYLFTVPDVPKKQQSLVAREQEQAPAINNPLTSAITILPNIESAEERQWLLYFSQHAGASMSDIADKEFWTRVLPQLSVSEPAIRHALLAVGSCYARHDADSTISGLLSMAEYDFSIKHYSLAIAKLRKHFVKCPENVTVPLICCLLFICLECLYCNRTLVSEHLDNGLNILSSAISDTTGVVSERSVMQKLEQIFYRLDVQATLYGRPVSLTLIDSHSAYDMEIPKSFGDLMEAKRYLDKINSASFAFIRLPDRVAQTNRALSLSAMLRQRCLQEMYISWKNALDVFDDTILIHDTVNRNMSARLRIEYIGSFIYLSNCLCVEQTSFDAYKAQFATIVALAHRVMPPIEDTAIAGLSSLSISPTSETTPDKPVGFALEASFIPALYFAALKCRDPVIRRKAVSLLERHHGREGLWDAQMHSKVLRRVIELEERSMLIYQGATDAYMEDGPSMKMQASNGAVMEGLPFDRFRIRGTDVFRAGDMSRSAQVVFYTKPNGAWGPEYIREEMMTF